MKNFSKIAKVGTPVKLVYTQNGEEATMVGLVTEVYSDSWVMVTWFDGKTSEVDTFDSHWDTLEVLGATCK